MSRDPFGLLGTTIDGKYRLDAVIGEGGFGVVFKGFHEKFDQPIAIKCLKVPAHFTAEARQRFLDKFQDEGKHLAKLGEHRSITRVYDFGVTGEGVPFMVLEWLEGRDLEHVMRERLAPFSEAEALALMRPAIDALALAHSEGIAHRDIKPANLFLTMTKRGEVLKVLDFGISKAMQEGETATQLQTHTSSGFSAFSPKYGAPEQFRSKKYGATGPWTDVHAIGLILVEMVTGRPPFEGEEMADFLLAAIDDERPTPRALHIAVSDPFEELCHKALARSPKERFDTASELLAALDRMTPSAATSRPQPAKDAAPPPPRTLLQAPAQADAPSDGAGVDTAAFLSGQSAATGISQPSSVSPASPTPETVVRAPLAAAPVPAATAGPFASMTEGPTNLGAPSVAAIDGTKSRLRGPAIVAAALVVVVAGVWAISGIGGAETASVSPASSASQLAHAASGGPAPSQPPTVPTVCESDSQGSIDHCRRCGLNKQWAVCVSLGLMYLDGSGLVQRADAKEAARYFRLACDGGEMNGCLHLGTMLGHGKLPHDPPVGALGLLKDKEEAVRLRRKACDGGLMIACRYLGDMYSSAIGVTKDKVEALRLYRMACDGGDMGGCKAVASCYQYGWACKKDMAEALRLYRKACDGGYKEACRDMPQTNNSSSSAATGAKPPSVTSKSATVAGRLPPEVINRIVRQNFGRFRACYETGLKKNPKLQGRVSVRFVIQRDGSVGSVAGSGDIPDGAVVSCVTRAFYGLSFPQPEGGVVTVSYPIVFTK